MFPIESVFNEIAQTFPNTSLTDIAVPSSKSLDEINRSKEAGTLLVLSESASIPKQDYCVPHINARDPDSTSNTHPKNERILNVVLEGVGASGPSDGVGGGR
jgi:hypothetical protein